MPLDVSLTTEEQVRITATPKTLAGKPAALDGALLSEVLSGDATVVPGSGPLELLIRSGEAAGSSQVRVFADADLGEGVVLLEDLVNVNVTGVMAANLGITASAPELKS